jgi:hypothetical protein
MLKYNRCVVLWIPNTSAHERVKLKRKLEYKMRVGCNVPKQFWPGTRVFCLLFGVLFCRFLLQKDVLKCFVEFYCIDDITTSLEHKIMKKIHKQR